MTDVFISYKRRMRPRVMEVAEALRALGLDVWFDAALEPGRSFAAEISAEVRNSKCVLVLWTNDCFPHGGDKAGWVVGEATIGFERGVLVTAKLERCDLDPPWNTIHTENLFSWSQNGSEQGEWRKVLAVIGQLVGRPDLAEIDTMREAGSGLDRVAEQSARAPKGQARAWLQSGAVAILSIGAGWGALTLLGNPASMPTVKTATTLSASNVIASLSSAPQGPIDLGAENLTVMTKTTTAADQSGLGRSERVLTIEAPTTLTALLAKNGFTDEMIAAIQATLKTVLPDQLLPARAHLRILFGASRTSDTLIPYRLSIYHYDKATDTDRHQATVALTDRGTYILGLAPPPIAFPDGGKGKGLTSTPSPSPTVGGKTSRARPISG